MWLHWRVCSLRFHQLFITTRFYQRFYSNMHPNDCHSIQVNLSITNLTNLTITVAVMPHIHFFFNFILLILFPNHTCLFNLSFIFSSFKQLIIAHSFLSVSVEEVNLEWTFLNPCFYPGPKLPSCTNCCSLITCSFSLG